MKYSPEEQFDQVRVKYRRMGGVVRGLKEEFENFKKKHKKTWQDDLDNLMPGLIREECYRKYLAANGKFVPSMKYLTTWVNNRCWTTEYEIQKKEKPKCFCGREGQMLVCGVPYCSAKHRIEDLGW